MYSLIMLISKFRSDGYRAKLITELYTVLEVGTERNLQKSIAQTSKITNLYSEMLYYL